MQSDTMVRSSEVPLTADRPERRLALRFARPRRICPVAAMRTRRPAPRLGTPTPPRKTPRRINPAGLDGTCQERS